MTENLVTLIVSGRLNAPTAQVIELGAGQSLSTAVLSAKIAKCRSKVLKAGHKTARTLESFADLRAADAMTKLSLLAEFTDQAAGRPGFASELISVDDGLSFSAATETLFRAAGRLEACAELAQPSAPVATQADTSPSCAELWRRHSLLAPADKAEFYRKHKAAMDR